MRIIPIIVMCALAAASLASAHADTANVTTNTFPRADVVTLLDETKVNVAADGSFTALRHMRQKILTARGKRAGDTVIPFNEKYQSVEFHFAKAVAADGSEQTVKEDAVESVIVFPGNPAYSDVRATRYRIRGAEVGGITDQEYVLKSKPLLSDQFWMLWRPRSAQPVLKAELALQMPAGCKFQWRVHNADLQPKIIESSDKQWKTYTWTFSDRNELVAEPYMPAADEIVPWIEISTVNSWEDIANWLDELSHGPLDSNQEIGDRVRALTANRAGATDKLTAIFNWIGDNVRFVSVELGISGYKPRNAPQTLASRYGDSKDLCVLLAAMLRDAGIPARLAFLESGSARKISDRLPIPRQLTHCIVVAEADGRTFYLDPTAETASVDTVLGRLCNTELLLIGKGADKWVPGPLYDGSKHGTRERAKLQMAADGSLKGEIQTEYVGESAAFIRAALKSVPAEQVRLVMEQEVKKSLPEGRVLDYEVSDLSARRSNFVSKVRFEASEWATVSGDKAYFKPQIQQKISVSDQWLSKGDRVFPFQFFETANSMAETEILLPDGFVVESLPKDVEVDNAYSYWKRTIRQEGNKVIVRELSHLKTVRLPKENAAEIRKFYDAATAHKNEFVVLKKK